MLRFTAKQIFCVMPLLRLVFSHALYESQNCKGCAPEHLLSTEVYGLDVSPDYLYGSSSPNCNLSPSLLTSSEIRAVAVQHVNGTLGPIAITSPGLEYQSLMDRLFNESDISPYGYGIEEHKTIPQEEPANAEIRILSSEISKIVAIVNSGGRQIQYYSIAMPSFFTSAHESLLLAALQPSNLPKPYASYVVDWSIYNMFNTENCIRQFEFDCGSTDYSYNPKSIIFVEYSKSTLSGYLYGVWGPGYVDRVAYLVDPEMGKGMALEGGTGCHKD